MSAKDWYESWFESPWYSKLYKHRSQEEADKAVMMAQSLPFIKPEGKVLDLCCGYGRHALALAELGFTVTGLDGSQRLIARAKEDYAHQNVTYVVGDMRGPYPEHDYDVVVNFFTSFGYFESDVENLGVIAAVFQSLKPGGVFVLDFFNEKLVRSSLNPESVSLIDNVTIIEERSVDSLYVRKKITVNNPCSHELEYTERVRLYSKSDLLQMTEDSGFEILSVFGDYDGSSFNHELSKRCIVIARKPDHVNS